MYQADIISKQLLTLYELDLTEKHILPLYQVDLILKKPLLLNKSVSRRGENFLEEWYKEEKEEFSTTDRFPSTNNSCVFKSFSENSSWVYY
ncbi:Hypothetical predicted protein [Octopus vulgaris]|uniref:Uncharacterized protein n=1 Tax=Octopus vulgaris TaxID=6645 RepID=A0AA36F489_OCTVU|nr:Hypothetical predicted protein [Octopus vulgaris]